MTVLQVTGAEQRIPFYYQANKNTQQESSSVTTSLGLSDDL